MIENITKKAILIKVTVHQTDFTKIDKKATREVAIANESDVKMGKYTKNLLPKEDLIALNSALNGIFPFVCKHTLPWLDGGWRLLPITKYLEVQDELRKRNCEIEELKEELEKRYESLKLKAEEKLGKLYRIEDYIPVEKIQSKFGIDIFYNPVPKSGDIRVEMDEEELEKLKKSTDENAKRCYELAMKDIRDRMMECLQRLSERMKVEVTTKYTKKGLKEVQPRLFSSLIENIRELMQIIPDLNIENDSEIETLRQKIEEEFADLSIEVLREDKDLRKEVAKKADSLLKNLEGLYQ